MNKKHLLHSTIVSLFCLSCTLVACQNSEELDSEKQPMPLTFDFLFPSSNTLDTRATETEFEENDCVGIYMTNSGENLDDTKNVRNNVPFTYHGSTWTAPFKLYWDDGTFDVYAYYPYVKSITSISEIPFSVQTDQSTHAAYTASDFLWGGAYGVIASNNPVKVQFNHKMSRLTINIKYTKGKLTEETKVYVHSTVTNATIDLHRGLVTKVNKINPQAIQALKINDQTYAAIIVPQRLDDSIVPLIEVVTNGSSYLYEGRFVFKTGINHEINVTI